MVQFFILLSIMASAMATTFQVQPIEQQIKDSDGLFQGNYLRSKTVVMEDGALATQMMFKMNQEVGLESEFYGMDEVIVHYPGGKTAEEEVRVEGVPKFIPGEKVVLFIRNVENRYWGMNLGFGSFRVINYGKEKVLVNTLFPGHPEAGQVTWTRFEAAVKKIKRTNLKVVRAVEVPQETQANEMKRSPASVEEGQNRTLASETNQSDNQESKAGLTVFWLVTALGVAGGFYRMNQRRTVK